MKKIIFCAAIFGMFINALAFSDYYSTLLNYFEKESGQKLDAESGKKLFEKQVNKNGEIRSCVDCHNIDIKKYGKEKKLFGLLTKIIPPMAVSTNSKAFLDFSQTNRLFDKDCKYVFGRLCTAKEKGDMIYYFISN
jgi:hypothetical protein